MAEKKVIDIHVHMGGPGDSGSGCRMSFQFIFSPAFAAMLITLKATLLDFRDDRIKEIMLGVINDSQKVDRVVLLALDGVYRNGRYVESESHLVIPNDYILKLSKECPRVLLGASVHPYRRRTEMIVETKKWIDQGAVLFKWIPSSQQIDPRDDKCLPFYEILAEEGVPLLCHGGAELAVPTSDPTSHKWNDPRRLKKALEMGVKIIVAHGATPYLGGVMPDDKDYFEELIQMLRISEDREWKLYTDLSAFCTPTRIVYLKRINKEIKRGRIHPSRFLYGSDFPIPIVDINTFTEPLDLQELLEHIAQQGNPLDNNYNILKEFGIHESIFTNANDVLRLG